MLITATLAVPSTIVVPQEAQAQSCLGYDPEDDCVTTCDALLAQAKEDCERMSDGDTQWKYTPGVCAEAGGCPIGIIGGFCAPEGGVDIPIDVEN